MPSLKTFSMRCPDPTSIRLSDHFLLSDVMGCHSVYTLGYPNIFEDPDGSKLAEGRCLAENVLEPMVRHSPLSVTYGYISLELARKIVTYQSPEKPSYHQWNDGAAVDIVVHRHVNQDRAPILLAEWMDRKFPMSRTITYAESEGICVATRLAEVEAGKPRRALYENRHIGMRKPEYINYSANPKRRAEQLTEAHAYTAKAGAGWRGQGYPSYHGGGIRQLQHIRVGNYCLFSDFMFSVEAVTQGHVNALTPTPRNVAKVRKVGEFYDALLETLGVRRLSIVRAYESPRWSEDPLHTWQHGWAIQVVPPVGTSLAALEEAARHTERTHTISGARDSAALTLAGAW